jgi:hypothetical protein
MQGVRTFTKDIFNSQIYGLCRYGEMSGVHTENSYSRPTGQDKIPIAQGFIE